MQSLILQLKSDVQVKYLGAETNSTDSLKLPF